MKFTMISNLINHIQKYMRVNNQTVIIYQPGKVASSSIEKALCEKDINVIHTHKISNASIKFFDYTTVDKLKLLKIKIYTYITKCLFYRKKCFVITLFRDQHSRNLSHMFHHIDQLIYARTRKDSREHISSDSLFQMIYENDINIEYQEKWYRDEFLNTLKITDSEVVYDSDLGMGQFETKGRKVLILNIDRHDPTSLSKIISEFIGCDELNISTSNLGKNKWYSTLYESFKTSYNPSTSISDYYLNNEFYKKFLRKNIEE